MDPRPAFPEGACSDLHGNLSPRSGLDGMLTTVWAGLSRAFMPAIFSPSPTQIWLATLSHHLFFVLVPSQNRLWTKSTPGLSLRRAGSCMGGASTTLPKEQRPGTLPRTSACPKTPTWPLSSAMKSRLHSFLFPLLDLWFLYKVLHYLPCLLSSSALF